MKLALKELTRQLLKCVKGANLDSTDHTSFAAELESKALSDVTQLQASLSFAVAKPLAE